MVGREELVNAVALNSMTFNGARIIGPALAGLVIANFGIAPALYFNTASFVAVIFALYLMRERDLFRVAAKPQGSALTHIKEGLDYARRTPILLMVLIVLAAVGTFGYNFTIVLPLISDFVLHSDAAGFGLLSSAFGLGSLIAAIATAYVGAPSVRRVLLAAAAFSVLLALTAVTPVFLASALIIAVLGAAGITFATAVNSLMQLNTPDELRGRVMSLNVLLIMGSTPIGAFLIGLMSDHLGVSAAVFTCALFCGLGVIGAAAYWRHHTVAHVLPPLKAQTVTVRHTL
jgi:predicted MFS family arabinose efflux permease